MTVAELELQLKQAVEILTPTGSPTRRFGEITAILENGLFHVLETGRQKVEVLPKRRLRAVWNEQQLSLPGSTQYLPTTGTQVPSGSVVGSTATNPALLAHLTDYANPHQTSKQQVGLGQVDNTSDLDKPLSTAATNQFDFTQRTVDGRLVGDLRATISGVLNPDPQDAVVYTCDTELLTPTFQWYVGGVAQAGQTTSTYGKTISWDDDNKLVYCLVTSQGIAYRSNDLLIRVGTTHPQTTYDFYVSPTGVDTAPGTSPNTPWQTFAPLETYMDNDSRSGQTIRVKVGVGTYQTKYSVARTYTQPPTLIFDFDPNVVIIRGTQNTPTAIHARGNIRIELNSQEQYDFRPTIRDFDQPNGIGIHTSNTATVKCRNIRIVSCTNGIRLENTSIVWFLGSEIQDSFAESIRQISASCQCVATGARVIARNAVNTAIFENISNGVFVGCEVIPTVANTPINIAHAEFRNCKLGTPSVNLRLLGTGTFSQQIYLDSYINADLVLNHQVQLTRCYGTIAIQVAGSTSTPRSVIEHCAFVGAPAAVTPKAFIYRNGANGLSSIRVLNTVLTGYTAANTVGEGFTSTEISDWLSNSTVENCCFFNNSGTLVPGIASSATQSLLADPELLDPVGVEQKNYGVGPLSPCIGAGLSNATIGYEYDTISRLYEAKAYGFVTQQDFREELDRLTKRLTSGALQPGATNVIYVQSFPLVIRTGQRVIVPEDMQALYITPPVIEPGGMLEIRGTVTQVAPVPPQSLEQYIQAAYLRTTDPLVAGQIWNNNGVLTYSDGAGNLPDPWTDSHIWNDEQFWVETTIPTLEDPWNDTLVWYDFTIWSDS
jgi:hypothetical protein